MYHEIQILNTMKKVILIITTIVGVVSCNRVETDGIIEKQEPTLNDVSFSNFSKITSTQSAINLENTFINEENGLKITLGRKSRNCFGFGICEIGFDSMIMSDEIYSTYSTSQSNQPKLPELKYNEFIFLDKELDDNIFDTTLIIEEDIVVNNQYLVKKGEYQLDKSIGKFGGYKLNFIKL